MEAQKRFSNSVWVMLALGIILVGVGIFFLAKPMEKIPPKTTVTPTPINRISDQEKSQIDIWVKKNDLNQYGDPKDTVYTGGTPLFNEGTGENLDKYDYISAVHPDKPWEK